MFRAGFLFYLDLVVTGGTCASLINFVYLGSEQALLTFLINVWIIKKLDNLNSYHNNDCTLLTVKLLLDKGADPNQKDMLGNTPLHLGMMYLIGLKDMLENTPFYLSRMCLIGLKTC